LLQQRYYDVQILRHIDFPLSQADLPTVTIAISTLNEAENIKKLFNVFYQQIIPT
jgi:hypothetical protein